MAKPAVRYSCAMGKKQPKLIALGAADLPIVAHAAAPVGVF